MMQKRKGLVDALKASTRAKNAGAAPAAEAPAAEAPAEEYASSAVNLRRSDWRFLRRVAEARADIRGGRPSVSAVLQSLIDANREKLQAEIDQQK